MRTSPVVIASTFLCYQRGDCRLTISFWNLRTHWQWEWIVFLCACTVIQRWDALFSCTLIYLSPISEEVPESSEKRESKEDVLIVSQSPHQTDRSDSPKNWVSAPLKRLALSVPLNPIPAPFPPIYIIEVTCAHSLCDIALVWIWHFSAVSLLHIAIAFSIIARVRLNVTVFTRNFCGSFALIWMSMDTSHGRDSSQCLCTYSWFEPHKPPQ